MWLTDLNTNFTFDLPGTETVLSDTPKLSIHKKRFEASIPDHLSFEENLIFEEEWERSHNLLIS